MEGEITEIQERLETITEEGTIYPTLKDGNVKWYVWKNGRREYLSKKNDKEIRNLVNKKYLELYLKDTINELRLLETNRKARKKYKTDYAQKMLMQKHYSSILLAVDKKENEETNEKPQIPNPEALRFYTKMGIIVRSKSEVIIATALYDNNIKFEYEKPFKSSNGIYYPDFTVEKKNGDIILWEHLGLIDNPDYRNKAYRKILKYNENGYYQGKNLILTYETAESPLDPMDVEHEIEKCAGDKMLKKLRRKFIAIAMLSVSIVLIAIVGTINIANYISTNEALDARLKLIAGNGGTFPDLLEQKNMGVEGNKTDSINKGTSTRKEPPSGKIDVQPPEDMNPADLNKNDINDNDLNENDLKRHGISPESQFDTRYFTVTINSKGDVENIDTSKIASVSSENAAEYAKKLWKSGKKSEGKRGFAESCKYLTVDKDGSTMYILLSCQREISTIRTYVLASVGISVFGLVVVFIMIYFFSGKILKPVSESYEKQKRFITDASHEIKTPLTIIDANTEVIEMMEGENEWTNSTRKQVARLTSLTEKLVFLSRMDEEATKLEMLEFSLSDAILDTAEPFKAVAGTKGKKLTIDVADRIPYTGDEKTIRQLISILLDMLLSIPDVAEQAAKSVVSIKKIIIKHQKPKTIVLPL